MSYIDGVATDEHKYEELLEKVVKSKHVNLIIMTDNVSCSDLRQLVDSAKFGKLLEIGE